MLKLQAREPEWLDIMPGVRVLFAPIGLKAVRAAREAVREALGVDEADLIGASDALSRELIARGILDWEGVGDQDGEVLAVNDETKALFLDDPRAFDAADRAYALPWILRDAEKNASAVSPNGIGGAATPVDDTASLPATPAKTDGADPILRPAKVDSATISPTSPRPNKAKASGKS